MSNTLPPDPSPSPAAPSAAGFRAGLVALVGRTNVGKSTLLNALVDAKISIVSPKPQTTRHAIQGVVNRPGVQLVFVDTPGFFRTRRSALVDGLHARAREALEGIDALIHVVDPSRPIGAEEKMVIEALSGVTQPRVLCLNKSDLKERAFRDAWYIRAQQYASVVEVSASARLNLEALIDVVRPFLPVGEPLFPVGEITNASLSFRIGEIIREKIYLQTEEEVPYRTAVRVNVAEERPRATAKPGADPVLHVEADLLVAEERYKGMLIGARGARIRDIGSAARRELEAVFRKRVRLELQVRVDASLP